jgi:hypothetical protein
VPGFVEYGGVSVEQSAVVVNNPAFGKIWLEKVRDSLAGDRRGGVELLSRTPSGVRERMKIQLHAERGDPLGVLG